MLARSGFTARYDWAGIYATAESRAPRDVRGRTLAVRFEIVDKRPLAADGRQRDPGPLQRGGLAAGAALPAAARQGGSGFLGFGVSRF